MGRGVNATPLPLYPRKDPVPIVQGGLVGPQCWSGRVRKILPLSGFDPPTVKTVASLYTA